MTRRWAILVLVTPLLELLAISYIASVLGRSLSVAIDWLKRLALPAEIELDQAEAALLAALLTAAIGLWASWSVKSREVRNNRADQMADTALQYHHLMIRVIDLAQSTHGAHQRVLDKGNELTRALQSGVGSLFLAASTQQIEDHATKIKRLEREFNELMEESSFDTFESWLSDLDRADARLRMFGSAGLQFVGNRALRACRDYFKAPTDSALRERALNKASNFLIEARIAVEVMRRWWGRRLLHNARIRLMSRATTYQSAWLTVFGEESTASVAEEASAGSPRGATAKGNLPGA